MESEQNKMEILQQIKESDQIKIQIKQKEEEEDFLGVPQRFIKKNNCKFLIGEILRIEYIFSEYEKLIGSRGTVAGWARTVRPQASNTLVFIDLNDGSQLKGLQIVVSNKMGNFEEVLKSNTSFSYRICGQFVKSPGKGQTIEMLVDDIELDYIKILGTADNKKYPLAAKFHKPETLREIAHLRPRTNLIGAVARVRNSLIMATHTFYQSRGFLNIHTPLITASDCEGAGSMFQVTTILDKDINKIPMNKEKTQVNYEKEFFKKPAYLTVSGQLAVENYCCALSNVYTFGPTFRAEVSHTQKHLAEFWMIEPEIAFGDINDCMDLAEDYLKFCINYCIVNNEQDLQFFDERVRKGLIQFLTNLLNSDFKKLSYTECIDLLLSEISQKKVKFENPIKWGVDLSSEHEKYLTELIGGPLHVFNYPKQIKSFYMKDNNDSDPERQTVACVDVLVPKIGELIGGSQREDNLELLIQKMKEVNLNPDDYWWYLDLRRFGTIPHSGFGLGFERLVMLITGVENIRDVIPFPRVVGNAEF